MASTKNKRKRKGWGRYVELAAALNQIPIRYRPEDGKPIFMFTHEQMQELSAKQVIAQWRRDHDPIRFEDGGPEAHWNLTWRVAKAHELKSGREQTQRGKDRKIAKRNQGHVQAMVNKGKAPPALIAFHADNKASGFAITKAGHFGRQASSELRRAFVGPRLGKRPMPHGRNSKTKRTMRGKVVPRNG